MNTLQTIRERMHAERMQDPIYREGYEAEHRINPYAFDEELSRKQMEISTIDRPLTQNEREQLRAIGEQMNALPWSRWQHGNHSRHVSL